ncbi:uncharacterized protein PAC_19009 [Phialocephala subalpina]|uniref:Fungal N-terminal domain-containing protein n=1 Tax=Phialocephala subalpina TaxID=576137 RepID=A0A1L7XVT1_9HELO|nr:uncharacterized protein PAC_19009 [Phialocephala subalpina]
MDPLTIVTSVVGLLKAAKTLGSLLSSLKTIHDAPRSIGRLLLEVQHLEMLLITVQKFLVGLDTAPTRRTSLIQVDALVAILTDLVLAFSDLDIITRSVSKESGPSFKGRWTWPWKEENVSKIARRLESLKSSLSLMLNIAQCESDMEAESSRQILQDLVRELLESNADISRRLRQFEERANTQSLLTIRPTNNALEMNQESGRQVGRSLIADMEYGDESRPLPSAGLPPVASPFEVDLSNSRVYQRTELYECDVSFTESNVRTHAWSIFSGLSLSEISLIAAIAVPIFETDISNAQCYQFGDYSAPEEITVLRMDDKSWTPSGSGWPVTNLSSIKLADGPEFKYTPPRTEIYVDFRVHRTVARMNSIDRLKSFHNPNDVATVRTIITAPEASSLVDRTDEGYEFVMFCHTHLFDETSRGHRLDGLRTFASTINSHAYSSPGENVDFTGLRRHVTDRITYTITNLTLLPTEYEMLGESQLRSGEGFILAYSCGSQQDFWEVKKYYTQVQRAMEASWGITSPFLRSSLRPKYPLLLVGLISSEDSDRREVSTKEGRTLAREWGCRFMEAEPDIDGIREIFSTLVRQIRMQRGPETLWF